jgi:hypothetical protein
MDAPEVINNLPDVVTYIVAGLYLILFISLGALCFDDNYKQINIYEDEEI